MGRSEDQSSPVYGSEHDIGEPLIQNTPDPNEEPTQPLLPPLEAEPATAAATSSSGYDIPTAPVVAGPADAVPQSSELLGPEASAHRIATAIPVAGAASMHDQTCPQPVMVRTVAPPIAAAVVEWGSHPKYFVCSNCGFQGYTLLQGRGSHVC